MFQMNKPKKAPFLGCNPALVGSLIILFVCVAGIELSVVNATGGVFMYPLDDTFIHLTIAQNLSQGSWSINAGEFASASSSLLYTCMLTVFEFFSNSVLIPFIVNCLAGVCIMIFLHRWLSEQEIAPLAQSLIGLLVIFFTPLPLMIISGMEHTLQCLFSFLFIFYFSETLKQVVENGRPRMPISIYVFAILVATIRYEGLFLIAIACALLLYYKRFKIAVVLGSVAIMPLLLFGVYSLAQGSYFLPNSVLIKSESLSIDSYFGLAYNIIFEKLTYARNGMAALATQRWCIILPLSYIVFRKTMDLSYKYILFFLATATLLQLSFGATGYLYRYEAYLFFSCILIAAVLFYKHGKQEMARLESNSAKVAAMCLMCFLLFPVVLRSATGLVKAKQACVNIFEQQYQMAEFTKLYYDSSNIALNDIGAVAYYTNAEILDLWGLANIDIAKSKRLHYWSPEFLDSIVRNKGVELAIIYDSWFGNSMSNYWQKVATWQIQNNVICGDDTISFYSIDRKKAEILRGNLQKYESSLPKSVIVKYYY